MLEIILAVSGIMISILLSAPILNKISAKRADKLRRKKWSAKIHFDEGLISVKESFAYERWDESISVDDEGNSTHSINICVVNRSDKAISEFRFPAFCDRKNIRKEELKPWGEDHFGKLDAAVAEWDEERSRGRFEILLRESIAPAKRVEFRWGYIMPATFNPGDEYFCFDIASPMFEMKTTISFSNSCGRLHMLDGQEFWLHL